MAINTRQSGLLVAENWKKIYQTFQEADFTSYDFETLRKTMIDYLRLYYPEDFNDFIESSEFVALIDLIAFMGQSLSFRTDLNARENFIDTAERRDSILKLARLINYNPKRNSPATGYLKIDSVITTETLFDSNGLNLSNLIVNWNDQTNDYWLEQFTTVINAALVNNQAIGKPGNSQLLSGVLTEEYSLNLIQNVLGVYGFKSSIEGTTYDFEAVSASSLNKDYIYELPPTTNGTFNILYRNDNFGNSSNDTGFFIFFKQGTLNKQEFNVTETIPNRVVSVNSTNINNTDVWLYALDSNGQLSNRWSSVPAVTGINVIYNDSQLRNLYQINTLSGDQIDLVFGDGSFANMPIGNFRVYYRVSNGLTYKITPDEMRGITLTMPYISRENRVEQLTIRASLQYTVSNASARETSDDIRKKAPQQYYTQNRMITGEDYNILPYTSFGNVIKVKSINRTSAGLSRYLDVVDSTGKYSSTNIFGSDGVLYKENFIKTFKFSFNTLSDVLSIINTQIIEKITSKEMLHFFYGNYPTFKIPDVSQEILLTETIPPEMIWQSSTIGSNESSGYFKIPSKTHPNDLTYTQTYVPAQISGSVSTTARYLRKGAIVRFRPLNGYYFDAANNMIPASVTNSNSRLFIYASVLEVFGDGTNNGQGNFDNGSGPVIVNLKVPSGAVVDCVYPMFANNFTSFFSNVISTNLLSFNNFGVTYDIKSQTWKIISTENLNITGPFTLSKQLDTSGRSLDSSWLIRFEFTPTGYISYYRGIDYIFHSVKETKFYFDETTKIFDTKTGTTIHDQIKIFKTQSQPDSSLPIGQDITWYVAKTFSESDGYVNKNKIYITYSDTNNDGIPDNPDLFNILVNSALNLVYFEVVSTGYENFSDMILVDNGKVDSLYGSVAAINYNKSHYLPDQIFYAFDENKFYTLDSNYNLVLETKYLAKVGRQDIAFQYRHNSPSNRRIDPSSTNIIDVYLLTSSYERDFRNWIQDTTNTISKPNDPTVQELSIEFSTLNNIKSISDTIVFNSARYKLLFGTKAPNNLQATFKVVKNPLINISDNDIKTSVIAAINNYFDIANWEFGETFYFSELSAYLHRVLSPNVASIMIVPLDTNISFGNLYQINAEPNEIIASAATVDNVEIVTAVTLAGLNMTASNLNNQILI